jgi:hypothetical protein
MKPFINNDILQSWLYRKVAEKTTAKSRLTQESIDSAFSKNPVLIRGEEHLGLQKTSFGGVIITTKTIGEEICEKYNETQKDSVLNKSFSHKALCEHREEVSALLFIKLSDLVAEPADMNSKELCHHIQANISSVIREKLPWLVEYTKKLIVEHYSVLPNKLKIRPNYILDDGIYEDCDSVLKGGLFLNGFLEMLDFYTEHLGLATRDEIGFIAQISSPNGLPRNKKWIQIDLGISFIGKRELGEDIKTACINKLYRTTRLRIDESAIFWEENMLHYATVPGGFGYEGYNIYIWEVLYRDQIMLDDEPPVDKTFCKCQEREKIITSFLSKKKKPRERKRY